MSEQEQTRNAFLEASKGFGRWDPAIVLGMLGDELHRACGFTGTLHSLYDLESLTDAEAKLARELLPPLVLDLPDIAI